MKKTLPWLLLTGFILMLDQATKYLAIHYLSVGYPVRVLPFFNFTLGYNTGAAFSFLSQAGGWQSWFFIGVASIVSILIIIWLYRLPKGDRWISIALSLVLGGALGNLLDRIIHGYVIDFIQIHYQFWFFPDFNFADAAITIGAAMLVFHVFYRKKGDATPFL